MVSYEGRTLFGFVFSSLCLRTRRKTKAKKPITWTKMSGVPWSTSTCSSCRDSVAWSLARKRYGVRINKERFVDSLLSVCQYSCASTASLSMQPAASACWLVACCSGKPGSGQACVLRFPGSFSSAQAIYWSEFPFNRTEKGKQENAAKGFP